MVGDLVTDVLVRHQGPAADGSDSPAQIRMAGGGAAANTAAWLAGAGVPVTLVARVGDDPAGRDRVVELRDAGVEVLAAVDPTHPTGAIVVLVAEDGERAMFADRAACDRLDAAEAAAAVAAADGVHLHLSGYVLLGDGSRPAGLAALEAARAGGLTTSVDAASAAPLAAAGPAAFLAWVSGVDLLFANAAEAAVLTGRGDPGAAAGALAERVQAAIVKDGSAGACWRGRGGPAATPAVAPAAVADTTGAGDAFAAAVLAAWLGGADAPASLAAGARLGARAVGRLGGRPLT